jgi:hypothetical protein
MSEIQQSRVSHHQIDIPIDAFTPIEGPHDALDTARGMIENMAYGLALVGRSNHDAYYQEYTRFKGYVEKQVASGTVRLNPSYKNMTPDEQVFGYMSDLSVLMVERAKANESEELRQLRINNVTNVAMMSSLVGSLLENEGRLKAEIETARLPGYSLVRSINESPDLTEEAKQIMRERAFGPTEVNTTEEGPDEEAFDHKSSIRTFTSFIFQKAVSVIPYISKS